MANTPDVSECAACRRQGDARLPIDPWRSLAVHFGMLLGVEDFKTVDAYHRGKMWLHSAWLNREGVIWGLAPSIVSSTGELRIEAGLALDACGRELHLDRAACIDLGRWFSARAEQLLAGSEAPPEVEARPVLRPQPTAGGSEVEARPVLRPRPAPGGTEVDAPEQPVDAVREGGPSDIAADRPTTPARPLRPPRDELAVERPSGPAWIDERRVKLDAHVRMRFVGCLDRQVPALVEPCDGAGRTTAYSRVYETVELELVPGLPDPSAQPYPRLRMLFGLDEPDAEIVDARATIAALPASEQPRAFEELFQQLAALDAAELEPALGDDGITRGLLPAADPAWFVLAELHGLTLRRQADHFVLDEVEQVLWQHRPTHVATRPQQDLLAATLTAPSEVAAASEGPRVIRSSLTIGENSVRFETDKPLDPHSLGSRTLRLSALVPSSGWHELAITSPQVTSDRKRVRAGHAGLPTGATCLRLLVDGPGSPPLLGADGWPLAGADDDPPTPAHAGRDFAHIERPGV
ncbi:MAG: hypothetical protein R6X02_33990 [Enhygromyxa sp.]